ncbi:MAG: CopG family transcriptional regulator [Nitrosomonadales bacterium]|nr:CopG family transcriptional regulator [Nitrosomonadales bacterium]
MGTMGTPTLRLPDNLDRQLTVLAAQTHQNRSELARTALEKFVRDQGRKQFMDTLVSEAKAEGRKPGDTEPAKRWK